MKALLEQVSIFNASSFFNKFKIQKYYQNGPNFNGVYRRNDLRKTKDWAYVINLYEFKSIGTSQIAFYVNNNHVTYFDSFGVEHIPKEIRKY